MDAPSTGQVAPSPRPSEPLTGSPGAVVVFSDVAHPLELLHDHPLPRRIIDAEIPVCASVTPRFGWSLWQGRLDEYPVTSLLAAQAVQAARRQSEPAAVELDLALRRAFFVQSRCISVRSPGVRTQWRGRLPAGTPVLLAEDPGVYR